MLQYLSSNIFEGFITYILEISAHPLVLHLVPLADISHALLSQPRTVLFQLIEPTVVQTGPLQLIFGAPVDL